MARAYALSLLPYPHSQNLTQILYTKPYNETITKSSASSSPTRSWIRIFSSTYTNNPNYINIANNIVRYVHSRRFSSILATQLSPHSNSHLPLRSSCDCICVPSLSLLPLRRSRLPSLWVSVMSSQTDEHGATINQDSTKTVRCMIKGRVQGVFYRNWTIENAIQLGLKGWVRNRRDRSVEALFSGKAEVVDEMVQRCRRGPPDAVVTALDVNSSNEEPGSGFERKTTV